MLNELWNDYFNYLIWRCNLEKFCDYGRLFYILHDIDFTYILDRDENRADGGIELRDDYTIPDEFEDETIEDFYLQKCSVLEMLIALAIRVDDEFIGDPAEEHPEKFFMEMIKNLKLDRFNSKRFCEDDVIKIVQKWLDRKFDRDGNGSPFPVKYSHRDQREVEVWDQMNAYISENYG